MAFTDTELVAHLERFMAARTGRDARIAHLERSTEGFSQETFVFDVETASGRRGSSAIRRCSSGRST